MKKMEPDFPQWCPVTDKKQRAQTETHEILPACKKKLLLRDWSNRGTGFPELL